MHGYITTKVLTIILPNYVVACQRKVTVDYALILIYILIYFSII